MSLSRGVQRSGLACASPASTRARTALRAAVLFGASAGALAVTALGTGSSAQAASGTPVGAPDVAAITQQAAEKAAPAVKQAAEKAAPAVEQAAEKAAPAVEQAAEKAAPAVEQAAEVAAPPVKQAAAVAAPAVQQAAKTASPVVEQAAAKAAQTAAPAVQQAGDAAAPVTKPATDVLEIARRAADALRAVSEATTKLSAPVVDPVAETAGSPLANVLGVAQPVVDVAGPAVPVVTAGTSSLVPVSSLLPVAEIAGPALQQTIAVNPGVTIVQVANSFAGVSDVALPAGVSGSGLGAAMRPVTDAAEASPAVSSSLAGSAPPMSGAAPIRDAGLLPEPPAAVVVTVALAAALLPSALGVAETRAGPRANAGRPSPIRVPVPVSGVPGVPAGSPRAPAPGGDQRAGGGFGELVSVVPAPVVLIADGGLSARMAAEKAMQSSGFVDGIVVPV